MKKRYKGSLTIEAAYLIPLILLVFGMVISMLFYYHDKNVLLGTAHETAAYGAGLEHVDEDMLDSYLIKRTNGRLLLFTILEPEIEITDEKVKVTCTAKKRKMSLKVTCSVNQTDPEDYIRSVRKIIKIGEGKGKQN